jgi:4-hydroxy-tetrahydrodipicolinate reductase
MGQMITGIVANDPDVDIVAGIDVSDHIQNNYPVYKSISECDAQADVIIDFANASAVDVLLEYAAGRQIPVVLCTTGLSEAQLEHMKQASTKVAILKSANMSLGINTIMKLLKEITPLFAESGFDIEIVEKHHNQKLDAPSGTALALADSVNEALDNEYEYVYDRSNRREKRPKKEIGISAVRGGSIVGDHDVIFAGMDEVVTISHTAYSRAVFGKGAVAAAKFLAGKGPGMYDMSDVING